jgi:hypothetical protein
MEINTSQPNIRNLPLASNTLDYGSSGSSQEEIQPQIRINQLIKDSRNYHLDHSV